MRLSFLIFTTLFTYNDFILQIEAFDAKSKESTEKFLNNFFSETSQTLTIISCWNKKFVARFGESSLIPKRFFTVTKAGTEKFKLNSANEWIVIDTRECDVRHLINKMDQKALFNYPFKHLFLVSNSDLREYLGIFQRLKLLPMSEVAIGIFNESYNVDIIQPYKVNITQQLILEHYGNWSLNDGIKTFYKSKSSTRRTDLQGQPMKVGIIFFHTNMGTPEDLDNINLPALEFLFIQEIPVINALMERLNATLILRRYSTHGYGYLNKTSGYLNGTGMTQDVYYERIDMTSSMVMTTGRLDMLKFLAPVFVWEVKFILKKPPLSQMKNIYVLTFSSNLWFASFIVLVLFLIALHAILNTETLKLQRHKTKNKYTLSDVTLLSLQALCQQGTERESKKNSGKLATFFLFLMFMFIYIAYSAAILVLLRTDVVLQDLNDLMKSRLECGGVDAPYTRHFFQLPRKGILRALYLKKLQKSQAYYEHDEGLKKVQQGNFAFHLTLSSAYEFILKHFSNSDICSLQELPGFMTTAFYNSVPRTSQYIEILRVGYLDLSERGLASRAKLRVVAKPSCNNQSGNFQSVTMYDCLSILIIYAVGLGLSMLILVIEMFVNTAKRQKGRKLDFKWEK